MAYFPKSKIQVKETSGDEFIYSISKKSYKGFYIEFSDGNYYAGTNPRNLGESIEKPEVMSNSFGDSNDFQKYKLIRNGIFQILKKHKEIPTLKNIPTEKDYERGYYPRYFVKRINLKYGFMETNKETYDSMIKKENKYDYNLYIPGSIIWDLTNSTESNKLSLIKLERAFPSISTLFPLPDEFQKIVQTNLSTEGGEYYLEDGTEYKGLYHVHPDKGPMIGASHISTSHDNLFILSQLSLTVKRKLNPALYDPMAKFRDDNDSGEEAERIDEGRGSRPTGRPSGGSGAPSGGGGGASSGGGGGASSGGGGGY